jgi:parallel beta-helix repeat protein
VSVGGTRPVVSGVVSADNTIIGMSASMADGVIKNNRLIGNDGDGLSFGGTSFGKIIGNEASHNSGTGIVGTGAAKGLVRANRAFGNGSDGMNIGTGGPNPGAVVVGNRAGGNGGDGISVSKSPLVEKNVSTGNASVGFNMNDVERIAFNYSTDNSDGFQIGHFLPGALSIEGNQAHGNDDDGLEIEPIEGTKVVKNRADANGDNGIEVDASVAKVKITGNRVSGNGEGIFANQLASPLIDGNTATGNGMVAENGVGLGINAAGTTTPTGKNVAYGNDDPDECDPTSLCPD